MRTPEKKRNGKWQIRYEDQHRKMRYATYATKREAEIGIKEKDALRNAGVDPARKVTFEVLVREWTESHLATGLRPSTVKDYKQSLKRLSAHFGQLEVRKITAGDLEKCRNELIKKVVSERMAQFEVVLAKAKARSAAAQTEADAALFAAEEKKRKEIQRGGIRAAGKVIGTARTMWTWAVSRGYAPRNVAEDVKKPVKIAKPRDGVIDQNILTPVEIEHLIAHTVPQHRCAVRFLFMTGVRLGELGGLQWGDIDWRSNRMLVQRQRSGIDGEMTEPKTEAGTRWVDLPKELITQLKAHKLATPGEYVFPIDARNWRSRVWHPALRRAGLRSIRIHDARHTHASLLIGSGADVVAVSRRLGHSNPSITLGTYSHAFARRDTVPLGEHLAAFMKTETSGLKLQAVGGVGCDLVVSSDNREQAVLGASEKPIKIKNLVVAREGIEPPTRGFSVRCSTN